MCSDGSVGGGVVPEGDKITYICPDGRETFSLDRCRFTKPFVITQVDAEKAALAYVKGYVAPQGWTVSLINVHPDEDWKAQLVISKRDEEGYETNLKIDSVTGVVTCEENCQYLN